MVEGTFDKREGRHNEITNPYRVCMTRDKMKPEATVHWQMQAAQTESDFSTVHTSFVNWMYMVIMVYFLRSD